MLAINCCVEDLEKALEIINEKYAGNVMFKGITPVGSGVRFTLRVKSGKGSGHRVSFTHDGDVSRRYPSACWHVHGDFFDALFTVNPRATIVTAERTISVQGGNWYDWNIGSVMYPLYFSDACECDK